MSQEIYRGPFPDLVAHLEFQRDTLGSLSEQYNLNPAMILELAEILDTRIVDLQNLPLDADITKVMDNFWEQSAEFEKKVTTQK